MEGDGEKKLSRRRIWEVVEVLKKDLVTLQMECKFSCSYTDSAQFLYTLHFHKMKCTLWHSDPWNWSQQCWTLCMVKFIKLPERNVYVMNICEKGNKNPQTTERKISSNILFTQHDGSSLKIKWHNLLY